MSDTLCRGISQILSHTPSPCFFSFDSRAVLYVDWCSRKRTSPLGSGAVSMSCGLLAFLDTRHLQYLVDLTPCTVRLMLMELSTLGFVFVCFFMR